MWRERSIETGVKKEEKEIRRTMVGAYTAEA
jgi:hypothetical protein